MKMKSWIWVALMSIALGGCTRGNKKTAVSQKETDKATAAHAEEIAWHKGGMESALQEAKAQNKPLFVCWGAIWCPPCNTVKATVFTHPDFIAVTKDFISVYLDGDTSQAQIWGEKLKATGYPTLLILNPKGQEVLRLTYALTPLEMARALKDARTQAQPMEILARELLQKKEAPVLDEMWQKVANHEWVQNPHFEDKAKSIADLFKKLETQVPAHLRVEKNKIFLIYISAKTNSLKENEKWPEAERREAVEKLKRFVAETPDFKPYLEFLAWGLPAQLKVLYPQSVDKEDAERNALILKVLEWAGNADSKNWLPTDKLKLFALWGMNSEAKKGYPPLPVGKKEQLQTAVLDLVQKATGKYERAYVVSDAADILFNIGAADIAQKMLDEEIPKSPTPYYLMTGKAVYYREKGEKALALEWFRKAYEAAQGSATRLEWGARYLRFWLETEPQKKAEILTSVNGFWSEALKMEDAFAGRSLRALKRVEDSVKPWSKKQKANQEIQKTALDLQKKCDQASFGPVYRQSCQKYFQQLGHL